MSDWLAVGIATLALLFTVGSWWWLNARRGRLRSFAPHSFAYVGSDTALRLRLPLVLENTGPTPLVVQDMRLHFPDEPDALLPIPWTQSRSELRPGRDDGFALPAVFPVAGHSAEQHFIEFSAPFPGLRLEKRCYSVQIDVQLGHRKSWTELLTFPLFVEQVTSPEQFIAYRNAPFNPTPQDKAKAEKSLAKLLERLQDSQPPA